MPYYRRKARVGVPGRFRGTYKSTGSVIPKFTRRRRLEVVKVFPAANTTGDNRLRATNLEQATPAPGLANCLCLNEIPMGTGDHFRLGAKIRMRSLLLSGEAVMGHTESGVYQHPHQHLKLFLVYDRSPQYGTTTAPNWKLVYENSSPHSMTQRNFTDRFKLLWEKDIHLESQFTSTTNGTTTTHLAAPDARYGRSEFNVKIPIYENTTWQDESTSGLYQNMIRGALWLFTVSMQSQDSYVFANPYFLFQYRLSYDDLA